GLPVPEVERRVPVSHAAGREGEALREEVEREGDLHVARVHSGPRSESQVGGVRRGREALELEERIDVGEESGAAGARVEMDSERARVAILDERVGCRLTPSHRGARRRVPGAGGPEAAA